MLHCRDALQQVISEQLVAHGVVKKELTESKTECANLKQQVDQLTEDREVTLTLSHLCLSDCKERQV